MVECRLGCANRGSLFLEGGALKVLEFAEGSLEFARQLLLRILLGRLRGKQKLDICHIK